MLDKYTCSANVKCSDALRVLIACNRGNIIVNLVLIAVLSVQYLFVQSSGRGSLLAHV